MVGPDFMADKLDDLKAQLSEAHLVLDAMGIARDVNDNELSLADRIRLIREYAGAVTPGPSARQIIRERLEKLVGE